ncbi:hypothetical protein JTY60_00295 [symbiont of Argiope bruennichi]|uniref:hypothetical protein n=1 Tax=symbiont of Argiope bruennichi TaxID=2810479 RepID=UPI003DA56086
MQKISLSKRKKIIFDKEICIFDKEKKSFEDKIIIICSFCSNNCCSPFHFMKIIFLSFQTKFLLEKK